MFWKDDWHLRTHSKPGNRNISGGSFLIALFCICGCSSGFFCKGSCCLQSVMTRKIAKCFFCNVMSSYMYKEHQYCIRIILNVTHSTSLPSCINFMGVLPILAIQMVFVGFIEVFPLWMVSTPEVGGLGWSTKKIGEVTRTILGCIR